MTTTYTTASGAFVPQNVTLFATPQNDASAVNVLALFAAGQLSASSGSRVIGGLRYEQLKGYLPTQSSPASPFAAAGIGGFAAQPRSFAAQPNIVMWNTVGTAHQRRLRPDRRRQDGREGVGRRATSTSCRPAAAASATSTRTRTTRSSTRWNDLNGNHKFELGEQTGVPVVSAVVVNGQIATSIDPNFNRPYTTSTASASIAS